MSGISRVETRCPRGFLVAGSASSPFRPADVRQAFDAGGQDKYL